MGIQLSSRVESAFTSKSDVARWLDEHDRGSFNNLMGKWRPEFFSVARGVLRNPDDAEMACQVALLKIYLRSETFASRNGEDRDVAFRVWCFTILMNSSRDVMRQRGRWIGRLRAWCDRGLALPLDLDTHDRTENDEAIVEVMRRSHMLSAEEQRVVRLCILCGLSVAKAAANLEVSPAVVANHLRNAKRILGGS